MMIEVDCAICEHVWWADADEQEGYVHTAECPKCGHQAITGFEPGVATVDEDEAADEYDDDDDWHPQTPTPC